MVWYTLKVNQLETKLNVLINNNGAKFISQKFNEFCKKHGIKRHRTIDGTPQQNGLAERINITILERVRCMLLATWLPKSFQGESIATTLYMINICLSTRIKFKIPAEVWSGKLLDYSNLNIFGALEFAHIKQDKLDSRVVKCAFIGYHEGLQTAEDGSWRI